MNKAERDESGFLFSTQAESILDKIDFTPEGAATFFRRLSKKGNADISRFKAHFFIRGGKVCVRKPG